MQIIHEIVSTVIFLFTKWKKINEMFQMQLWLPTNQILMGWFHILYDYKYNNTNNSYDNSKPYFRARIWLWSFCFGFHIIILSDFFSGPSQLFMCTLWKSGNKIIRLVIACYLLNYTGWKNEKSTFKNTTNLKWFILLHPY